MSLWIGTPSAPPFESTANSLHPPARRGKPGSRVIRDDERDKTMENKELNARTRISEMNFTAEQLDFIWSDWPNWDEHIDWLLTATRDEIVSWIETA